MYNYISCTYVTLRHTKQKLAHAHTSCPVTALQHQSLTDIEYLFQMINRLFTLHTLPGCSSAHLGDSFHKLFHIGSLCSTKLASFIFPISVNLWLCSPIDQKNSSCTEFNFISKVTLSINHNVFI